MDKIKKAKSARPYGQTHKPADSICLPDTPKGQKTCAIRKENPKTKNTQMNPKHWPTSTWTETLTKKATKQAHGLTDRKIDGRTDRPKNRRRDGRITITRTPSQTPYGGQGSSDGPSTHSPYNSSSHLPLTKPEVVCRNSNENPAPQFLLVPLSAPPTQHDGLNSKPSLHL